MYRPAESTPQQRCLLEESLMVPVPPVQTSTTVSVHSLPRPYLYERASSEVQAPSPENHRIALNTLDYCATLFGDAKVPFFVSGGLGAALTCDKFTRHLADLDVIVESRHLAALCRLPAHILVENIFSTHLTSKTELGLGRPVDPQQEALSYSSKIRVLLPRSGNLFRFIDVRLIHRDGDRLRSSYESDLPARLIDDLPSIERKGRRISIATPTYQILLKNFGEYRPKDLHDCNLLKQAFPQAYEEALRIAEAAGRIRPS
jgi:hypothetical protein